MAQKKGKGNDTDVFSLHTNDGSFTIRPRRINTKKTKKKKKKDVKAELENTKMDMIQ